MKNAMNMTMNDRNAKMEDDDYISDFESDDYDDESAEESDDVFAEFTDKVQSLLDDGAIALEIAEEKTAELEGMNPGSEDYEQLVEEIKVAQERARASFEDAEFLIQKANEILQDNK